MHIVRFMDIKLFVPIIFLLLFKINANAALVMQNVSFIKDNPDKKGKGTIYISDNRIKFSENISDSDVIFDIANDKIIRIYNKSKTYEVSSLEKYIELVHEQWQKKKQQIKMDVSNLPKDKREFQVKILKSRGIDLFGEEKTSKLKVVDSGDNQTIAGLQAKKFKIYRDSTLIEEYWLSNKIEELDYKKFANFYGNVQRITNIIYLETDKPDNVTGPLESMFVNGFPLKYVDYQTKGIWVEEITKIESTKLTDLDFKPPADYKEVSF